MIQQQRNWLWFKKQKAIEQELDWKFIRIDPDREDFSFLRALNEIFRHIKLSIKEALNKTLTRLSGLEFKPKNIIKSKAMKFIVKDIFADFK